MAESLFYCQQKGKKHAHTRRGLKNTYPRGPARIGSGRLGSAWPGPARLASARLGFAPPLALPGAKKVSKWLPAARCKIHCKN